MGRISENGFRAILELPLETPFEMGYRQGRMSGQYVSFRQAQEQFPGWPAEQIDIYLNGRDDGVAGDTSRIDMKRAAALWPVKNWASEEENVT